MNKAIHRIWLNEEPPPPALQRIGESWEGEDVRLWTIDDVMEFGGGWEPAEMGAKQVAACVQEIWGNSIEAPRAFADWARVRILQRFGGLYVDMDCELAGDSYQLWVVYKSASIGDVDLVVCRPSRPAHLENPRPCNGVMYTPVPFSQTLDAMRYVIEARLCAMCAEHQSGIYPEKPYRPVHQTGPDLLHAIIAGRSGIHRTPDSFAAFKGCEKPKTRIIIHQGWRQY